MPLIKQKRFNFSILCDVFLLMWLVFIYPISRTVLLTPVFASVVPTTTLEPPPSELNFTTDHSSIVHERDSKSFKLSKRFDMYNDFSRIPYDTIHRILRDEEDIYRNDDQRIQRRWKKSPPPPPATQQKSQQIHTIRKRSIDNDVVNINNKSVISEIIISNYSTKLIDLANQDITEFNLIVNRELQSNPGDVVSLNLTNNKLKQFNSTEFAKLVKLDILDLSFNQLTAFNLTNSNVKILNLSNNFVSNFQTTIEEIHNNNKSHSNKSSDANNNRNTSNSTDNNNSDNNNNNNNNAKVKYLDLSNNNINTTNYLNLSMLNDLEILDLSCNQIQQFDRKLFTKGKTLKRLNLSWNRLLDITKEPFYNLLNMDTLVLSYNNISNIGFETFLFLPNLQYLDLSNNNIQSSSIRALQGIPDLVGLSIANNPNLGDSLQEFVASWSLKELDASGTGLCRIPAALAQSVRTLKLINNWFSIIRCGDLDSYPLLQYLDLSSCHIEDIEDDALGRLEILQTLFLDHNSLKRVPISLPTSLEHLFLHNNLIMDIQPQIFQQLSNLKTLDLSRNKLMYLPGLPLPKLLTLNLQSSELRGLSQSVVKTSPKLRDLLLEGNPIKCPDLLGIAEWASPCRNDGIIERMNIKYKFESMHDFFQDFHSGKCRNGVNEGRLGNIPIPKCAIKSKNDEKLLQSNKSDNGDMSPKTMKTTTVSLDDFLQLIREKPASMVSEQGNSIQNEELYDMENADHSQDSVMEDMFLIKHLDSSLNASTNNSDLSNVEKEINKTRTSVAKNSTISAANNSNDSMILNEKNMNVERGGQQQTIVLSEMKSDNNYVETSVLLSQKDSSNRTTTNSQNSADDHTESLSNKNVLQQHFERMPNQTEYLITTAKTTIRRKDIATEKYPGQSSPAKGYVNDQYQNDDSTSDMDVDGNKDESGYISNESTMTTLTTTTTMTAAERTATTETEATSIEKSLQTTSAVAFVTSEVMLTTNNSKIQDDRWTKQDKYKTKIINWRGNESLNGSEIQKHDRNHHPAKTNISPTYNAKPKNDTLSHFSGDGFAPTVSQFKNGARNDAKKDEENHSQMIGDRTIGVIVDASPISVSSPTTSSAPPSKPSSKMMPSKVNKADKVVFFDQPSAIDENGVIKRNQSDVPSVFASQQHYQKQQIQQKQHQTLKIQQQKLKQKQQNHSEIGRDHRQHKQQEQEQDQDLKQRQPEQDHQQQKKMQKRPKLRTSIIQGKRYNQDSQQKISSFPMTSNTETVTTDNSIQLPTATTTQATTTTTRKATSHQPLEYGSKPRLDKHLKFSEEKKLNVTVLTFSKGHTHKTINRDNYPPLNRLENEQLTISDLTLSTTIPPLSPVHFTLNTAKDYYPAKDISQSATKHSHVMEAASTGSVALRGDGHYKVNTELSTASSQLSSSSLSQRHGMNSKPVAGMLEINSQPQKQQQHHHTNGSNTANSAGLPPEQWLDIRTATGHPGLFIVIGVTFGMLLSLGLIHIYRCRRPPWHGQHGHQFHNNHSHQHSLSLHGTHHPRRQQLTDTANDESLNYCDADDYYIEVDQEVNSPIGTRRDFLPLELLSSRRRNSVDSNQMESTSVW